MYLLHCINKFYPPVPIRAGSSKAHICLDRAGAKAIQVDTQIYKKLPINFKHKVLTTDFRIAAYKIGWGWGTAEKLINNVQPDIYYNVGTQIFVEIDTGTEGYNTLKKKAYKYNTQVFPDWVIFISTTQKRVRRFLDWLHCPHKAGCLHKDVPLLLQKIKPLLG